MHGAQPLRGHKGRLIKPVTIDIVTAALERFRTYCRFQPETGCVLWVGGRTMGRGHSDPYPRFWFNGDNWFGHRWSAKYIHGFDIESFHVDHCCPNVPLPNTLCVEHVRTLTPRENRDMQTDRRRRFIHLQVGILAYEDVYGEAPPSPDPDFLIPFYEPPAWLNSKGPTHDRCPF